MINNKLKINDSKTEFIVFRSPQAKQDLSELSVIVGDSIIQQSSKVRNITESIRYSTVNSELDVFDADFLYNRKYKIQYGKL